MNILSAARLTRPVPRWLSSRSLPAHATPVTLAEISAGRSVGRVMYDRLSRASFPFDALKLFFHCYYRALPAVCIDKRAGVFAQPTEAV